MSVFDAEFYAKAVMSGIHLEAFGPETKRGLNELQADIEATIAALEIERDSRRIRALRDDLIRFLPERTASIVDKAKKEAFDYDVVSLAEKLVFVCRATTIVSRAFVCAGDAL